MPAATLARRFIWAGVMLLLTMAVLVGWLAAYQLQHMTVAEAQARANLVAEDMADQVQLAVNVGVPLEHLVGVEELFAQRMKSFPGILRASLLDRQGKVLHERQAAESVALTPVVVPIKLEGQRIASLELQWRNPVINALLLTWGLPLVALITLTAGLSGEGLRYGLTGLTLRRERLVQAGCMRIAGGDLATRPPRIGRRDFDSRLPWLVEQLRHVGEQHMRVGRLAQSLRQTEPDFEKRQHHDQVFADALADDRFTQAAKPASSQITGDSPAVPSGDAQAWSRSHTVAEMPASSVAALQRWRGVLIGLATWAPLATLVGKYPAWVSAGALMLLSLVVIAGQRWLGWQYTPAARYGLLLGGLLFGPGFALLVQMASAPQHFQELGELGYYTLGSLGLAALVLPWFGDHDLEPLSYRAPD